MIDSCKNNGSRLPDRGCYLSEDKKSLSSLQLAPSIPSPLEVDNQHQREALQPTPGGPEPRSPLSRSVSTNSSSYDARDLKQMAADVTFVTVVSLSPRARPRRCRVPRLYLAVVVT